MGKWSSYALGVDVSHYNRDADLRVMAAKGNIDFAVAKCSDGFLMRQGGNWYDPVDHVDPKFSEFVQQAYEAGILIGAYHYFRPDMSQAGKPDEDLQFRSLKAALKNKVPGKSFHFLAIDLEEKTNTNTNTKAVLETFYAWMLRDEQMSQVPIIFYSSVGWLNEFPAVRDWLSPQGNPKEMWMAQWVKPASPKINTTWQELRQKYYPADTAKVMTPGFANWRFWQWSSCYMGMEGAGSGEIDLNFYNGTTEQLYSWLKFTPQSQPQPQPEPQPEPQPQPQPEPIPSSPFLERLERAITAFCREWMK